MQILCIELVVEEQGFIGWLSRYMGFFVTSPGHSCKTVKIILTLYLENSDSKDDWKQKTWEDLVLKVMPTKSCSKNLIDYSMSRLPARYSVFFFFFIYCKLCFIRLFRVFQYRLFLVCFFICWYTVCFQKY